MRKIIIGGICLCLVLVGCQGIEPNPYGLTKETRRQLKPAEQETYIAMIQSLEALVTALNDETLSYEEDVELLKAFLANRPKDWSWDKNEKPMDMAWHFFMLLMDAFMGCQNYGNYADCKDDIDALGERLAALFEQTYERQETLFIDEIRFYNLYRMGRGEALLISS